MEMSDFTIGEAVGTGFRVVRRKPLTLFAWFAFQLVASLLGIVILLAMTGTAMSDMQAIQTSGAVQTNPTAALAVMGRMVGGILLLIPYYLFVNAVITTAANRAVLEPEAGAFGYLRIGASELRMMVVSLVVALIIFCAYIAAAMVGGLALAAVGIAARGSAAAAGVGVVIMVVVVLTTVIYLATRFALAPAQTLDTRSINIFGSWGLTKGHVGKIFVVYLLCGLIVVAIYLVLVLAMLAIVGVSATGLAALSAVQPKMTSIAAVFAPASLAYFVVVGLVGALVFAILLTPGAFMYQRIANRADEVF
jgi:hypothetical protein